MEAYLNRTMGNCTFASVGLVDGCDVDAFDERMRTYHELRFEGLTYIR